MATGPCYRFGRFRLHAAGGLLYRDDTVVALSPKVSQTLVLLVEHAGDVVDKAALLQRVWGDASVEEGSLTRTISLLRKALRGDAGDDEFVTTVSKRGYRFVAAVEKTEPPRAPGADEKIMLAVLPFENLGGNPRHEYFSDGLTEEMITQLGRLNPVRLGVIARTSAMHYKGTSKTISEIGRDLGVSYVLEGSVRRSRHRMRIAAQLIDVASQAHVWAESYERAIGDILVLQSDVARSIAREIDVKLTPRERRRLAGAAPVNARGYELYLKGRYFWCRRTEEGMRKGIEHFNRAIKHDPQCAMALSGLSDSYVMLACRGVIPATDAFQKATAAATRALAIDRSLGEAYASRAHVRLHDWQWQGLDEEFQRAIELNPGHAVAYYWYAEYLMAIGRAEESVMLAKRAQETDPLSAVLSAAYAMILYLARDFAGARDHLLQALELDASHFLLHFRLGLVQIQQGRHADAIREMRKAVSLSGRSTESLTGLAQAYAAAGHRRALRALLADLKTQGRRRYVSPYYMARIHASLNDPETTFRWLDAAFRERNPDFIELRSEPAFDAVRDDPRFALLVRRVGWI
jgi:TolB-like protein/Tfp pilus assembly protein PilF